MTSLTGILVLVAIAVAMVLAVAVVLAVPVALYNKLRSGRFAVSRRAGGIVVVLAVVLAGAGIYLWLPFDPYGTSRAQVSEGLMLTSQYKIPLAELYRVQGRFDGVSIEQLDGTPQGRFVSGVRIEGAEGSKLAVVATFRSDLEDEKLRGWEFRIATLDGGLSWQCGHLIAEPELRGAAQVDAELMPLSCR
jgi:hypothetical protein